METHQSGSSGAQAGLTTRVAASDPTVGTESEGKYLAGVIGEVRNQLKNRGVELTQQHIETIREIAQRERSNSQSVQKAVNVVLSKIV